MQHSVPYVIMYCTYILAGKPVKRALFIAEHLHACMWFNSPMISRTHFPSPLISWSPLPPPSLHWSHGAHFPLPIDLMEPTFPLPIDLMEPIYLPHWSNRASFPSTLITWNILSHSHGIHVPSPLISWSLFSPPHWYIELIPLLIDLV